ncbi:hypothetical protein M2101_001230 [Parabacteroides sp. PM5-20]|nr:hypothetical protein [Parabacteroides sp. PM5-20]
MIELGESDMECPSNSLIAGRYCYIGTKNVEKEKTA